MYYRRVCRKVFFGSISPSLLMLSSGVCYGQSVAPITPGPISGIDVTYIDNSIKPQEDFYNYANGAWLKTAVIADDNTDAGAFRTVIELSQLAQKNILDDLRNSTPVIGSDKYKAKTFLTTLLDTEFYNSNDLNFIQADLNQIENAKSHSDLAAVIGQFSRGYLIAYPFPITIRKDQKNPQDKIAYVRSPSVALVGRYDNYWRDSEGAIAKREAFKALSQLLLETLGRQDAENRASKVLAYDRKIAHILDKNWTAQINLKKLYNPIEISKLGKKYKGFDWDRYLTHLGFKANETIVLSNKKITKSMAELFASTELQTLKDHLILSYLRSQSIYLPKNIEQPVNDYFNVAILGKKERTSVEEQRYRLASNNFRNVIGQDYVQRYTTKKRGRA